jgi:hypothetical protein
MVFLVHCPRCRAPIPDAHAGAGKCPKCPPEPPRGCPPDPPWWGTGRTPTRREVYEHEHALRSWALGHANLIGEAGVRFARERFEMQLWLRHRG